jgi:ATP-dependent exoDNAse (exonuclease V) alpha subunit
LKPTGDQSKAIFILDLWKMTWPELEKHYMKVGGAAGTGKTWLINYMLNKWGLNPNRVLIMAYTGQAVSVMRMRGIDAFTIHSVMFEVVEVPYIRDGKPVMNRGIPVLVPQFRPVEEYLYEYDLIIVDEYSFVNTPLEDLIISKAYKRNGRKIPIIMTGDHLQLGPVVGESAFKEEDLDIVLNEPTRQALDSNLGKFLLNLRTTGRVKISSEYGSDVIFLPINNTLENFYKANEEMMILSSMVISATNKDRQEITNIYRREQLHKEDPIPVHGERMICRKNRWNMKLEGIPLVNGTMGYNLYPIPMSDIDRKNKTFIMNFRPIFNEYDYYDNLLCDLDFLSQPFGNKEVPNYRGSFNLFEHAYSISTHLSQGAEYPSVMFLDKPHWDEDYSMRVRYTAASRAKQNLLFAYRG